MHYEFGTFGGGTTIGLKNRNPDNITIGDKHHNPLNLTHIINAPSMVGMRVAASYLDFQSLNLRMGYSYNLCGTTYNSDF